MFIEWLDERVSGTTGTTLNLFSVQFTTEDNCLCWKEILINYVLR